MVTLEEFVEYYQNVGFNIERDEEFRSLIELTWNVVPNHRVPEPDTESVFSHRSKQSERDEFRGGLGKKLIKRSGMESHDNPLSTTS